jgi:pyrroline-5-carboxylate reductase
MKLGVIGAGNMGGALIRGFAANKRADDEIIIFDLDKEKVKECVDQGGVNAAGSMAELILASDAVLIALKPNIFDTVIPEIAAVGQGKDKVYISIAAGVSIRWLKSVLGEDSKVIRVMPNTPAMVGEGMAAIARSNTVPDYVFADVVRIFESVGRACAVSEDKLDVITGISGSSPAYAYMYIQALIEQAMAEGLDEEEAKGFAAQATLGAAKMVLESDVSPEQLRINVCSPGGTTIEAVHVLEDEDFIGIVKKAVAACIAKSKLMTK